VAKKVPRTSPTLEMLADRLKTFEWFIGLLFGAIIAFSIAFMILIYYSMNSRMDELNNNVGDKIAQSGSTLDARINGLESTINAKINGLESTIDVRMTGFENRMTGFENRLIGVETQIRELSAKVSTIRRDTGEVQGPGNGPLASGSDLQ
jgi:uncharacterized coiled-coil protein SlyX